MEQSYGVFTPVPVSFREFFFIEGLGVADSLPLSFNPLLLVGVFVLCGCCVFKYWHLFSTLTLINSFLCS